MLKKQLLKYEILEILKSKECSREEIVFALSNYFENSNIINLLDDLVEKEEILFFKNKYFLKNKKKLTNNN